MRKDPEWSQFYRATAVPQSEPELREIAAHFGASLDEVKSIVSDALRDEIWKNSLYQVAVRRNTEVGPGWPAMIHLSIKRLDRDTIHDWRDLQRIKNELIGAEHEAVELYSAESRLVDTTNQYHLWVLSDPKAAFPFGWTSRLVSDKASVGMARQRSRQEFPAMSNRRAR